MTNYGNEESVSHLPGGAGNDLYDFLATDLNDALLAREPAGHQKKD